MGQVSKGHKEVVPQYKVQHMRHHYLSNWIEEHKDEVNEVPQPEDCLVDIEWIVHVSIHQPRGVHERHKWEPLLL